MHTAHYLERGRFLCTGFGELPYTICGTNDIQVKMPTPHTWSPKAIDRRLASDTQNFHRKEHTTHRKHNTLENITNRTCERVLRKRSAETTLEAYRTCNTQNKQHAAHTTHRPVAHLRHSSFPFLLRLRRTQASNRAIACPPDSFHFYGHPLQL